MPDPIIDDPPPVDDPPAVDPLVDDVPPTDPPAEPGEKGNNLFDDDPPADPPEGIAPRPEGVPEKFWDKVEGKLQTDKVLKSEAHWREQYQKLMQDGEGVPEDATGYLKGHFNEEGDYFSGEGENMQVIPKDDPILVAHLEASLKHGLSPKQSDGYWADLNTAVNNMEPDGAVDKKAEIAKLGDNAKERYDGVEVFIDGLNLPPESIAALKAQTLGTAQGIQTMEALMAESGQLSIPLGTAATTSTHSELEAEWEALGDDPEALDASPTKQARYEHIGKKLHPDDNRG